MNIVCTVNLGGTYLPSNVMESHVAAAARWGANYLQLLHTWGDTSRLWFSKMRLHRLPVPPGSRIAYVDGDTLIRADCPSLFDLVPQGKIGGVVNPHTKEALENAAAWWDRVCASFRRDAPVFDPECYLNGGVLVFEPEPHRVVWETASTLGLLMRGDGPMVEQTALNVALAPFRDRLHILDSAFNCMGAEAWQPGSMTSYIYHFAPIGGMRGDKRERMESCDWRTVPSEVQVVA